MILLRRSLAATNSNGWTRGSILRGSRTTTVLPALHAVHADHRFTTIEQRFAGAGHLSCRATFAHKATSASSGITIHDGSQANGEGRKPPQPVSVLERIRPYAALARIDKPTGTLLLYLPCTWSITLAAHAQHLPSSLLAWNVFLFGSGAFIMRGAGCTINDMWDRRLDAKVERTKERPLASGAVTPFQALVFTGVQLSAGLAVLVQLNLYSIALGAASLGLVTIYPLMKRITYWPQLVLGLAFNWGTLLGWSAMVGSLQGAAPVLVPLYAGSIFWTLIYDTIYAHQDKLDDVSAGIKSTALLFGDYTRAVLSAFSVTMLSLLGTAVSHLDAAHPYLFNSAARSLADLASTGHPFFGTALGIGALHLAWQIGTVDLNSRADCWSKFRSNTVLGAILSSGLLLDYIVQVVLAEGERDEDEDVDDKSVTHRIVQ